MYRTPINISLVKSWKIIASRDSRGGIISTVYRELEFQLHISKPSKNFSDYLDGFARTIGHNENPSDYLKLLFSGIIKINIDITTYIIKIIQIFQLKIS